MLIGRIFDAEEASCLGLLNALAHPISCWTRLLSWDLALLKMPNTAFG